MEGIRETTISYIVEFDVESPENMSEEEYRDLIDESIELINQHLTCKGNLPDNIRTAYFELDDIE